MSYRSIPNYLRNETPGRRFPFQDKSSSMGPHAVRAMMNDGDDVLHVNVGTGLTTAHLASLIHADNASVIAVGIGTEAQRNKARQNIERLGAKCILTSCRGR